MLAAIRPQDAFLIASERRAYHRQDVASGRPVEAGRPRVSVQNVRVAVLGAKTNARSDPAAGRLSDRFGTARVSSTRRGQRTTSGGGQAARQRAKRPGGGAWGQNQCSQRSGRRTPF